ncbi:uncharacterized protein LOC119653595 [Hermetia illucens]|uniref:uncharacterized protein LOC119653595 n=1 Tax=Hermetia illucens TaxID=343691 RepID=UPI0018CBF333|nr:uncharacterized protein LOC119653595 [Hermetia illucens]
MYSRRTSRFSLVLFPWLLVISQAKLDPQKVRDYTNNFTKSCQPESTHFGDVHAMLQKTDPSRDEKCFITCTLMELGLLSESGEFQKKGFIKVNKDIQKFDDNPEQLKNIDEPIIDKCGDIHSPEKCHKGFAIAECGFRVYAEIHG